MNQKKIGGIIVFLLLTLSNVFAQNELNGTITDATTKKPLEGVSITLPDLKTGAITNASGQYTIQQIPAGTFLIQTSIVGYEGQIIALNIHGKTTQNFNLSVTNAALPEVTVTGVNNASNYRNNPAPVNIIHQTELQQNIAANIIDAIQLTPGVSQTTEGPALSKPVMRGLGYNRVLVINDGIRQEGQQWGDEFGIEIDPNDVDRVEIVKGPSSLSYGSDAMAGVINFLAPDPLPEGKVKGALLLNYQTNNGLKAASLNLAGNLKGYLWDIRYSSQQAHDYKNPYDGYVWNSRYGVNNFKAILGVNKKWGYSHVRLSLYDLKLGIIEGARDSATGSFTSHYLDGNGEDSMGIAPAGDYTKYNQYPIIHQHVTHYKAVSDNRFFIGKGSLLLRLAYQENHRREANDITRGDIFNNYFFLRTINYHLQYNLPEKNKFNFSTGINGMWQQSEDRGIVFLVPEYKSFDFGIFATAKKTIGNLTISGGLRWDNRSITTGNLYIDSSANRLNQPEAGSINRFTSFHSNFSGVSASAGLTYDFTKTVYGKLNIARGFRAPTIAESGSDGIHDGTPFYEIGDPNLKAENNLQIDATLGINTEDITAEATGFVNKINHYIFPVKLESVYGGDSIRNDFAAGFGGPAFKYIAGDAILSGGELVLNIHPKAAKWLHFDNSFSTVSAIQQNQGDSTKYLPYTPPSKFVSTIRLSAPKLNKLLNNAFFSIGIESYFKQDKIYYKFGDETVTPGYTLLNAAIGTDFVSGKNRICSLYFMANNLTDLAYQSNMSRIKYGDVNNVTGRTGVYNIGRNFSIKLIIPFDIKK